MLSGHHSERSVWIFKKYEPKFSPSFLKSSETFRKRKYLWENFQHQNPKIIEVVPLYAPSWSKSACSCLARGRENQARSNVLLAFLQPYWGSGFAVVFTESEPNGYSALSHQILLNMVFIHGFLRPS